jgi:hypothetical protein
MKIECTTTFLDGADRFEAGDIRTVDDERGARLVANGWATDIAGRVAIGTTADRTADLSIQNVTVKQEASHG